MTKKYKVEFIRTETFVIDVRAKHKIEAEEIAREKFEEAEKVGMLHYFVTGDIDTEVESVFDVTNTDDPFNDNV